LELVVSLAGWLVGYLVSELERTLALDYEILGSHSTDHEE
jgi:hypothetical protein